MAMLHQEIVRADPRLLTDFAGAMHRDMFSKNVVMPDAYSGGLVAILQILRRLSDNAAGKKPVSRANGRLSGYINMRANNAFGANFHRVINHSIRPDGNRGIHFGFGMDNRGRMNHV